MNLAETSDLLTFVARVDNRRVDDATAIAWHAILGELPLADCLAAARQHFGTADAYLMPVHIARLADDIGRERRRAEQRLRELDEGLHRRAGMLDRDSSRAIHRDPVRDRSAEATELVQNAVAALPVAGSDRVHQRAVTQARRLRGRPERLAPKRERRGRPKDWPVPQSDEIAALATRYLLDGYTPEQVAERFAVSRRWCQKAATRFRLPDPQPVDDRGGSA